jgi:transposase-like protein
MARPSVRLKARASWKRACSTGRSNISTTGWKDHGALKRLINPARGFKTLPTASATIKGFEVMRRIRKRQCLMLESGAAGEVRFVNRLFRLAA